MSTELSSQGASIEDISENMSDIRFGKAVDAETGETIIGYYEYDEESGTDMFIPIVSGANALTNFYIRITVTYTSRLEGSTRTYSAIVILSYNVETNTYSEVQRSGTWNGNFEVGSQGEHAAGGGAISSIAIAIAYTIDDLV